MSVSLYPYPESPTKVYQLSRMGKEILVGTEQECWAYIHTRSPYSVDYALRWGGYSIWPYDVNTRSRLMSDDLKAVLAKVKKLLRLAAGNANVNEAAAATAKAQELIDRYKLELGELDGETEEITSEEESLFESGRTVKWKSLLALRLAHANGCHVWTIQPSADLRRGGFKQKVKVVGKPSNIQILRYLFTTLVRELERLSSSNWKQHKMYWENVRKLTPHSHALDFKLGAVRAIGERLKEERQKVRSEHSALYGALSMALVRFDNEAAEAQRWLEERLEGLVPVKNVTEASDETAYAAGYKAGRGIVMTKGLADKAASLKGQLPGPAASSQRVDGFDTTERGRKL